MRATMPGRVAVEAADADVDRPVVVQQRTSVRSLGGWPSCGKPARTGRRRRRRPGRLVQPAVDHGRRAASAPPGPASSRCAARRAAGAVPGPWAWAGHGARTKKTGPRPPSPAKLHERDITRTTRAFKRHGRCYIPAPMSASPAIPTPPAASAQFGGRYVSEILMPSLDELTAAWEQASAAIRVFKDEFERLLRDYVGRPTPLGEARRLAAEVSQAAGQRRPPVPQARGPVPHRRAQDQQLHRAGAARPAHGQDPDHRRDRRRPARRGHRHAPARCSGCPARSTWARWTSSARR